MKAAAFAERSRGWRRISWPKRSPTVRGCHGELLTVPGSAIAEWIRKAGKIVLIDGCFLRCHGRVLENLVEKDKLLQFDALSYYKKYTDRFDVDFRSGAGKKRNCPLCCGQGPGGIEKRFRAGRAVAMLFGMRNAAVNPETIKGCSAQSTTLSLAGSLVNAGRETHREKPKPVDPLFKTNDRTI